MDWVVLGELILCSVQNFEPAFAITIALTINVEKKGMYLYFQIFMLSAFGICSKAVPDFKIKWRRGTFNAHSAAEKLVSINSV